MGRAPCCSKVGLRRGPWTAQEDMLLTKFIQDNGEGQGRALPITAGLLRCGKSCRLRWLNYLRPDIKRGNITLDEEELIIRMHKLLGNRWSLIAGRLPGRTDNEIKNFWNTHLRKKLIKKGIDPKTHQPVFPKEDSRVSTDFVNEEERATTKKKDMDSDRKKESDRHVQSVHLPKANRYLALPRSVSSPDTIGLSEALDVTESHASDVLLSPSIYLSCACSMSSLNSSHDRECFSAGMLCLQSPVNDHVPQSILPHNANDDLQDFLLWSSTDEEKERSLTNFQPEGGSVISNGKCIIGNEEIGLTGGNNFIPSPDTKLEFGHISKPENCLRGELQNVYEGYLELLREDPSANNSGAFTSNTADNDGEDVHVLQKHFWSIWDCLQGNN